MKNAIETKTTQTTKRDLASYVRPLATIGAMVGLMSFVGFAYAGVIDLPAAANTLFDWSGLFADGAATGFDAAGVSF